MDETLDVVRQKTYIARKVLLVALWAILVNIIFDLWVQ